MQRWSKLTGWDCSVDSVDRRWQEQSALMYQQKKKREGVLRAEGRVYDELDAEVKKRIR